MQVKANPNETRTRPAFRVGRHARISARSGGRRRLSADSLSLHKMDKWKQGRGAIASSLSSCAQRVILRTTGHPARSRRIQDVAPMNAHWILRLRFASRRMTERKKARRMTGSVWMRLLWKRGRVSTNKIAACPYPTWFSDIKHSEIYIGPWGTAIVFGVCPCLSWKSHLNRKPGFAPLARWREREPYRAASGCGAHFLDAIAVSLCPCFRDPLPFQADRAGTS